MATFGTFTAGAILTAAELNAMPAALTKSNNGGSVLYNPNDVGNGYFAYGGRATVTQTTGTSVLVMISADWNHVGGKTDFFSVAVSGATTIGASDSNAIAYDNASSHRNTTSVGFVMTVTAGSNTFSVSVKNGPGSYAQTINSTRITVIRLN